MNKKIVFKITTASEGSPNFSSYYVVATTAEEAIEKLTPKLDGKITEITDEIERFCEIDVE